MGSEEQRGLQLALPLTDLLEREALGTVVRSHRKEEELAHPGALSPKTHHSPLRSLNSGSVLSGRVSGRVRDRDDSGIFWSELKIE